MKKNPKTKKTTTATATAPVAPSETVAPVAPVAPPAEIPADGSEEATQDNIALDAKRANGEQVPQDSPKEEEAKDELTAREDSQIWNLRTAEKFPEIGLNDPKSNILCRYDYVPIKGTGVFKGFSRLVCSDNQLPVGKPFAGSYVLVNNKAILKTLDKIFTFAESQGLKANISTTGSLFNRERVFVSVKITGADGSDGFTVGGRKFDAFLNVLNSIPSSQGCTVTYSHNTFCVCCRNTFSHVLHDCENAKFFAAAKHTKNVSGFLSDIPKVFEYYITGNQKLLASLKSFEQFPVTLTQAEEFFAAFLGRSLKGELTDKEDLTTRTVNMAEEIKRLFSGKGDHAEGSKAESALDLFGATTAYYTHLSAGGENPLKQWQSSEGGNAQVCKGAFFNWLAKAIQSKANFEQVCKVGDTLLVRYRTGAKEKAIAKATASLAKLQA